MMRIHGYGKTFELVPNEPNIFSREIVYIDGDEYILVGMESYEFSNRRLGTHFDEMGRIAYVEDLDTGLLYVTILYDFNILLPIQNTGHIKGFLFDYHRGDNERADRRSLIRAACDHVYILPYYQVDVKFRGHHWFKFINHYLSFPLVYCACKYFFDRLYPDGYDSYDTSYRVDFLAAAYALNNIKEMFGKKFTRRNVSAEYCLRHYANRRDWKWSESVAREYGYNPLRRFLD